MVPVCKDCVRKHPPRAYKTIGLLLWKPTPCAVCTTTMPLSERGTCDYAEAISLSEVADFRAAIGVS